MLSDFGKGITIKRSEKGICMRQLSRKNLLLVGLTLFSMFFGAGNLIFPPFLGVQAGTNTWGAMIGFSISAIGLPILGVAAVAKSGGLNVLAGRVHPKFAFVFTLLIYLSIGPGLAIPRTASTSFEMAAVPFAQLGLPVSLNVMQVLYSLVFFGIALALAMNPDKLTERLGKILTPCLLTLILILFIGCLVHPMGSYGNPVEVYQKNPFVNGFLDGYQTMDTIAALNFGIIISLNIKAMGIQENNSVVKETIKAGFIAGTILLLVYCVLAHIGGSAGAVYPEVGNGAGVLTYVAQFLFGKSGMILLALIFFIACLNTCVGLLSCCSEYFSTILPFISYKKWVFLFSGISLVIANIGLNKILEVTVPVLNAIYPVAIILILLAFLHGMLGRFSYVYPIGISATGFTSVIYAMQQSKIRIPWLTRLVERFPLYEIGLAWILPALIGMITGVLFSILAKSSRSIGRS